MEKCYLFGAGINCYGVIKFIGKENIIAIIDNNENKVGLEVEGIKIISFSELMSNYQSEAIIISAYYYKEEIKKQLHDSKIENFAVAPYMQKGYFKSFDEMMSFYDIDKMENLYIYGENIFAHILFDELHQRNLQHIVKAFIRDEKYNKNEYCGLPVVLQTEIPMNANIFLTSELSDTEGGFFVSIKTHGCIIDMFQGKTSLHPELENFKEIHKGKRCFILGNGPSLNVEDLDILYQNSEICFGSNWILKMFNETKWRPTYYVGLDYNVMRSVAETLQTERKEHFITFLADAYFKDECMNSIVDYTYQSIRYEEGKIEFAVNIVEGIYSARTVTYDMIQIAAYMGFQEIYLLGVDCSNGSKHFYKSDTLDKSKVENNLSLSNEGWNEMYTTWIHGYEKAEEYSRRNGFRIYNATRGGELEVFERVDFDSLFYA